MQSSNTLKMYDWLLKTKLYSIVQMVSLDFISARSLISCSPSHCSQWPSLPGRLIGSGRVLISCHLWSQGTKELNDCNLALATQSNRIYKAVSSSIWPDHDCRLIIASYEEDSPTVPTPSSSSNKNLSFLHQSFYPDTFLTSFSNMIYKV